MWFALLNLSKERFANLIAFYNETQIKIVDTEVHCRQKNVLSLEETLSTRKCFL
jgi:hypothetical protein